MGTNYFTINVNYITIGKTFTIKPIRNEIIGLVLHRLNEWKKEVTGLNLLSVSHNGNKIDIFKTYNDYGIEEGDTLIVESELPNKDSEDKDVIKNVIVPSEVGIYEGELKNGIYEGKGRFYHVLGLYYDGEYKNGKKSGKGYYKDSNMNGQWEYEGEWENDERNGQGTWRTFDGETYEGTWKNDKKEGKGKTVYPNGDTYEGDFKNGLGNGKGKITWSYHEQYKEYEGDIKDDLMDGIGILKYRNGNIYEGEFKEDKRHGKGILKINGKIFYNGDWVNDEADGKGIMIYEDGKIYEGDFKQGTKEGYGKMTFPDGKIEEGFYESSRFIGDDKNDNYIFKNIKIISSHTGNINHIMKLKDGRFASCSDDCSLNIYNKDTYEIDLNIKEHADGINYFIQLDDGRIITCSKDKTLLVIELTNDNKYQIQSTLKLHTDEVYKLIQLTKSEIVSISKDNKMIIWSNKDFNIIKTIENESKNIFKINENEFVTYQGEESKSIKFWKRENYENISTINNIDNLYSWLLFEDDLLFIGGRGELYLIKISTHEIIKNVEIPGVIWSLFKCIDGNILFGVWDGFKNNNIIKYKYENQEFIKIARERKAHHNYIYNVIELDNGIIISGEANQSKDSFKIKVWQLLPNEKNN